MAVCPEQLGGLGTPRLPAEIQNAHGADVLAGRARVLRNDGMDVTREFITGADRTLEVVRSLQPEVIILKERSPSCGVHEVYDGSFSGKRRLGRMGVTAARLKASGFRVISESDLKDM